MITLIYKISGSSVIEPFEIDGKIILKDFSKNQRFNWF